MAIWTNLFLRYFLEPQSGDLGVQVHVRVTLFGAMQKTFPLVSFECYKSIQWPALSYSIQNSENWPH